MDRRVFLKLSGLVAAGRAVRTLPAGGALGAWLVPTNAERSIGVLSGLSAPSLRIEQPGTYQITGLVRLEAPIVEISGLGSTQSISWSDTDGSDAPVARFVAFGQYDRPGATPEIRVRGGQLEALTAVPLD